VSAAVALPIVLEVAKRVGAPLIVDLLKRHLGEKAGGIAGTLAEQVIDTIRDKTGAASADWATPEQLESAVLATETEMQPELMQAYVDAHANAVRLQLAEMEQGGAIWTWAWRPATMWLLAVFWLWSLMVVPLVNAALRASIPVYLEQLIWLTTTYMALYMGGHTIKAGIEQWRRQRA